VVALSRRLTVCRAESESLIETLKKQIESLQPQDLLQQLQKQEQLLQTQRDESRQLEILLSNEQQRLQSVEEERNALLLTLRETQSTAADLNAGPTSMFYHVSSHAGVAALDQKSCLSGQQGERLQLPQKLENYSSFDPPYLSRSVDKSLKRASISLNSSSCHARLFFHFMQLSLPCAAPSSWRNDCILPRGRYRNSQIKHRNSSCSIPKICSRK
jgi:hypothetical protein